MQDWTRQLEPLNFSGVSEYEVFLSRLTDINLIQYDNNCLVYNWIMRGMENNHILIIRKLDDSMVRDKSYDNNHVIELLPEGKLYREFLEL